MKPIETETYKGITINIHSDDSPTNPFEEWECEPPLLTYYGGRGSNLKAYQNAPETWNEILALLPASCFETGKRVEFVKQFLPWMSLREVVQELIDWGDDLKAYAKQLRNQYGATPEGWHVAMEWLEVAKSILNWGGITAVYEQSTGHCQGDVALCLAIATPEWLKLTGVTPENAKEQLEQAIKLYGDWAWGNVYGYTLEDENGEEVEGSCWGFYGWDHEKSGLLESAREAIECHLAEQAKEAETLTQAFTF